MKLVEKYAPRIKYAESYYAKKNAGATLDADRKFVLAQVLENQSSFLSESFDNTVSTQRSDMGLFKRFTMDIATLVLPNLIAPEVVLVKPMTAMNGYITYFDYVKSSNKGASTQGDLIVNPFKNGKVDPTYTSSTVVENYALTATDSATVSVQEIDLKWCPVVPGSVAFTIGGETYFDGGDGKIYKGLFNSKVFTADGKDDAGVVEGRAGRFVVDHGDATEAGTITYGYAKAKSVTGAIYGGETKAHIHLTEAVTAKAPFAINYTYNNIAIMQDDIPMVTAVQKGIYLMAKARRIAINYSQMAAFQAKQENGQDLGKNLEKVAVGTLKYEIDTEIVNLLVDNAYNGGLASTEVKDGTGAFVFNATPRNGVSLSQHFEGFEFMLENMKQYIYDQTQKFFPNYMICASNVINVVKFLKGWKSANPSNVNGPYVAGKLDNLTVIVTPNIAPSHFILGVNGSEFDTSAAVYCPYMALVPTSLLQTPDGATTQGWSTLYALQLLNKNLLVAGAIEFAPQVINIVGQ